MIEQKSRWFGRPMHATAATEWRATLGVCVLFFERPDQTIECLESLGFDGPPVYVWNNGSSPSARDAVARYMRDRQHLVLIDSPVNLGVAAGRNRLIEESREDLLLFLDSDITVETPSGSLCLRDRAHRWPDVEVLVPSVFDVQAERVDAGGRLVIQDDRFVHLPPAPDGHMNFFPGGAACVRRTLFERLGPYDESIFVGLEDYARHTGDTRRQADPRPQCPRGALAARSPSGRDGRRRASGEDPILVGACQRGVRAHAAEAWRALRR